MHVARKDFAEPIACAGGRSPDLDNVCRVVCPNGALAGDDDLCEHPAPVCTETQVRDASGVCVAACTTGNATGEGYSVTCTAETCSWTVDAGTPGCVSDNGTPCKKVCPAPLCELSYVNDEFGRPHLVCSGSDR